MDQNTEHSKLHRLKFGPQTRMLTPHQARSPENVIDVSDVKTSDAASVSLCIQTLTLRFDRLACEMSPWNASPWKLPVDVPKSFLEVVNVENTLQTVYVHVHVDLGHHKSLWTVSE